MEAGAAGGGVRLDGATVLLDDLPGDEEAEAGALVALGGEEGGEQLFLRHGGNARAVVGDIDEWS